MHEDFVGLFSRLIICYQNHSDFLYPFLQLTWPGLYVCISHLLIWWKTWYPLLVLWQQYSWSSQESTSAQRCPFASKCLYLLQCLGASAFHLLIRSPCDIRPTEEVVKLAGIRLPNYIMPTGGSCVDGSEIVRVAISLNCSSPYALIVKGWKWSIYED